MKSRMLFTLPQDIEGRTGELIQVAQMPSGTTDGPQISTSEAKSIILAARLIADLVRLIWGRIWDRYFWISERTVHIHLANDDLLDPAEDLNAELDQILDVFAEWCAARLVLNLAPGENPAVVEGASAAIEKTKAIATPSGLSLDQAFMAWMRKRSRVSALSFLFPLGSPSARPVRIPAQARILPKSLYEDRSTIPPRLFTANVAAEAEGVLLQGADGQLYVGLGEGLDPKRMTGRFIQFDDDRSTMIRRWILARVVS